MNINNITKKTARTLLLGAFILTAGACSDRDELITETQFDRLFMPSKLETRIQNKTNVRISWECLSKVDSYAIELFENDANMNFEGTPSMTTTATESPYVITGLLGETVYSVRIKAISETKESKWNMTTFNTDAEQILNTVAPEDLEATKVILRWTAGQVATSIVLTPEDGSADINYTVTANDIAAGAATITGLTGEIKYTAKLYNNDKVRGTITFTTPVDIGNATLVEEDDDLVAMLTAATEGEVFAIMPGEYALGEFTVTKSIALKGVRPADKPIVKGSFTISSTVTSLGLNAIILDGNNSFSFPFNANNANCKIDDITIVDCTIQDYTQRIIYSNSASSIGDMTIRNSIIKNIGTGGDTFDIRAGSFSSLTVENCTFTTGIRSLLRMQVTSDVAFKNCTFYKICTVDSKDNSGFFRISGGTLEVSKCLFVGTGVDSPTNASSGNWAKSGNIKATTTYSSNYYYDCKNIWVGQYTDSKAVDATEADPKFKDAANGDFTLGNEDLSYNKIGDSRWW